MVAHPLELGSAARVAPTWRAWRWMIDGPGDRIAWIAADDEGWDRLRREGELIGTLGAAGCRVPTVIGVDESRACRFARSFLGLADMPSRAWYSVSPCASLQPRVTRKTPRSPKLAAGWLVIWALRLRPCVEHPSRKRAAWGFRALRISQFSTRSTASSPTALRFGISGPQSLGCGAGSRRCPTTR